ncbi:MAG: hypothetical protein GF315_02825 [candidate division Zixibacteria bacterium]|nr:hypothetical protein [candidate division Zixibacteria bacterium]
MVNRYIRTLSNLIKDFNLSTKHLIAPTLRVGYQWLDSVTRAGQPVLNVHVDTLKKSALDIALPEIQRRGFKYLSGIQAEILVNGIFAGLQREGKGYLTNLDISQGLVERMVGSINDLRLAGISSESLNTSGFEVDIKANEIKRLLALYEAELERRKLVDYADILRISAERLRGNPGGDVLYLIPEDMEHDLKGLEREYWESIPDDQRVILEVDKPDELPSGKASDASLLRFISDPKSAPLPSEDGTARIFRAVGEVNEVKEVLRFCHEQNIPFDDVEIIHTNRETYVPLIYEIMSGLKTEDKDETHVTFAEGIPIRYSRPGRAVIAWLNWIEEGYPQATLVRMIQDGLLMIEADSPEKVNYTEFANILRTVPIGAGKERYLAKIDEEITAYRKRIEYRYKTEEQDDETDDIEEYARKIDKLGFIRRLVEQLLSCCMDKNYNRKFLAGIRDFLGSNVRSIDRMDQYAREYIEDTIKELMDNLEDDTIEGLNILEWLIDILYYQGVEGKGPRPGCLYVAPLHIGGHSGRKHTFIIGLDDARFPGSGGQDPILLDDEREGLSDNLTTSRTRVEKRLDDFAFLLSRLRGHVTLGYSCRNLIDDREMFPSPVLISAFRVLSGNAEGDYEQFINWVSDPVSFAPGSPSRCIDSTEWWIWKLSGDKSYSNAQAILHEQFPHLKRGAIAMEARGSDRFNEYDGYVPEAGADHDPTRPDAPVLSASRLETLGRCPMEYFFRYVLGIELPEEFEIDPSVWLDALQKGELLHSVFKTFMYQLRSQDSLPVFKRDLKLLHDILDREIEKWREIQPPPNIDVYNQQVKELRTAAMIFLYEEEDYCKDYIPLYFEASLGLKPEEEGTPLDVDEPVEIMLPSRKVIRARGRIDRIDEVKGSDSKQLIVWDYKTGSARSYDLLDPFMNGRRIQNVLYLEMLKSRLRQLKSPARIKKFGYYFVSQREHGERIEWDADQLEQGKEALQHLCDLMASGCFPFTDNPDDVKFSDYIFTVNSVADLASCAADKLQNPDNAVLNPFTTLRDYPTEEEDE